ncbi:hypothetical protein HYH02_006048 [Chlamydomonas schloesseri]|uniref:Uncharacterized protein n=1 Tax=Chlamydomonas schloesseri TaxID=2026947 RepID=A0A835WJF4_9CHLO|nr:hypothetical protein HYH02_006048 [Chlamydomonas schloesseri]|eukprot:KAG2448692.1 hypothetical protein HYH02_006048 [Chlamydomonas schloesseri]
MATLDDPPFLPGPMDADLARIRADQATAKFLPELLNSREFRERFEIRRRPTACARFTSGLLWALAGAAVLLLTALAFPQLLLLGGDVGRALSSRSVSSGTPAHSSWPAAPQQLQQHLHHPHQYMQRPVIEHLALGGAAAARAAGFSVAATRVFEAFGVLPAADPNNPQAEPTAQQPSASHSAAAPPADQLPWIEGAEATMPGPDPPTPPSPTPPAPPAHPAGSAAVVPHSADPAAASDLLSGADPVERVTLQRPAETAHGHNTAPKLAPSPGPTALPLSTASLDLMFRCRLWQPPVAAAVHRVEPPGGNSVAHDADVAASASASTAPGASTASGAPIAKIRTPRPLLAAFIIVLGLLVLALATLVAVAVSLAAPLADCLAVVLPASASRGVSVIVTANPVGNNSTSGAETPTASMPSPARKHDALAGAPTPSSPGKPVISSDAYCAPSPAARAQQLEPAAPAAAAGSPIAPSPAESASASGGTWSSCSGAGRDGGEHGATASAEATSATQPAAKTKANEETREQASDISTWAQVEKPSRAPSFRDQLPPLPEDLAGWVAVSVPSAAGDEPHSGAPGPQAAAPQAVAPPPHRQHEPSTPSAGAATSGSTVAAGGCSRLPSVLRPLATYGSTPIVQAPAAAATATSAAPGVVATPGSVSDEVSPPLDATLPAAPWPFAYPDSVERARLTATPTASTTSTGGSEGVRAAAAVAAAAALTPAVWSGTVAPLAVDAGGAEDSDHPIFDLSRYDSNGDELPLLPPLSAAAMPLPPFCIMPEPAEESAVSGSASAAAYGGAGRPPPHHRWRMAKKAVALKLHAARRAATDTSAHRDSRADGSVSGNGSASGGSGGALASGAAVNAALAAAADAADQHAAETPRLTTFPEEQLLRGASLTLQPMDAAEMVTPVWPPQHARQVRHAGTAAAAVPDGGDGNEDNGQEAESSGRFAAEALSLADCLSAARGCNAGGATVTAAAAATDADGEAGLLGGWPACAAGEPADLFKGRPAAAAYSPSISVLRLPAPPATAAPGCAAEPSREHAAAAAAAVATLQSLKHSARRLVEATRAGSYWRPQDGPDGVTGCDGDQDVRMAQTELHAAAAQLKQLRLTGPSSSGTAPAAPAPARKVLAFTPAATSFAAVAPAAVKMPRRPLADISTSTDSAAAGAAIWGVRRSNDSWASIGSRVVPQLVGEAAATAVSDSFLITPAPRAPPVAPQPIRRSKIPLLTPASDSASAAATTPATSSMPHLHLGTPAVVGNNLSETPMAAAGAAQSFATSSSSGTSGDSAAGGLSSILAEVAQAAAIKAMQAGLICPDLVSPPGTTSSASGGVRSGLPRLVPWPVLTTSQSQQSRPPAPAPTPASSGAAAPGKLCATSGRSSSALEDAVQDLDSGDGGGGPCSNRSSSDGSDGATDSNKENCQPPAEESPYSHSGASPDSGASPCSFRLAGRELPSDAEVQAFLAATALSRSPASDAAAPGASAPPPLSPLDSLLRVLPSAVEVLVVQLCALADLAAERQREVLAWHFQANACTLPLPFLPHADAPTSVPDVATTDVESPEQPTPTASSSSTATSDAAPPASATNLAAMTAAAAAASDSELAVAARCSSAEGRALALIGRLVDELLMMPSAEGLALELQAQAQAHHHEQEGPGQALLGAAGEVGEQGEPLHVAPTLVMDQGDEEGGEEGDEVGISDSAGVAGIGAGTSTAVILEETETTELHERVTSALSPAAVHEEPQQLAVSRHHPHTQQQQPVPPQAPPLGYPGLTSEFLAYLQEEDTFSLWSPSNAAAALFHEWAAGPPSAAPYPGQAAGPSPPSSVSGLTLLLPVQGLGGAEDQATPPSSSGSCTAGGPAASGAAPDAPPCPQPRRGDHDSGGGAYLRSVARTRAAAGENVDWHEAGGLNDDDDDEGLDQSDAGSHVGPWASAAFQRSGAPSPESPYLRLLRATAAAAVAMSGAASSDGSDGNGAISSPEGGPDSGQHVDTPVGRRLRVFAGMAATLPRVPAAPFADEELGAAAAVDSGVTTEPASGQGSVAAGSDGEGEAAPLDDSVAGSDAGELPPRGYSAMAMSVWSPLPDTPGSSRALWRPRLPSNQDA